MREELAKAELALEVFFTFILIKSKTNERGFFTEITRDAHQLVRSENVS